mmetsp:Transcript_108822/g.318389  ORF Transcript_108822/g.318389 Transcript_108822/m.318389 type:complete len:251 (-) Transcript_108822:1638-2390(-)
MVIIKVGASVRFGCTPGKLHHGSMRCCKVLQAARKAHRLETHAGPDGREHARWRGHVELLPCVREVRVKAAYPLDGGLEAQEAPLLHPRDDLRPEAVGHGRLVRDHEAAGLLDGGLDRVGVPGHDGLQVDDLAGDALLRREVRGRLEAPDLRAPANQRDVLPLSHNFSLAQGQLVVAGGDLSFSATKLLPIEDLRLEEEHGVWFPDRCQQQALGLSGTTRNNNRQARTMGEECFRALTVVHAAVANRGAR